MNPRLGEGATWLLQARTADTRAAENRPYLALGDSVVFGYITQTGFATAQADQMQITAITEGSVTVQ